MWRVAIPIALAAGPARACQLALLFAVDVSGSVDRDEYRIQMEGLAHALRDGIVADALVAQRARVALVQWTGASRQRQTIPWTGIGSREDVLALAARVEGDQRIWRNYSTAIGEALAASRSAFAAVPRCARKVVDLSGDGVSNEGRRPAGQRAALRRAGITVNAIAIETGEADLTAYFFENVIAGPGAFVVTARGFADYPAQVRRKLRREATRQVARSAE